MKVYLYLIPSDFENIPDKVMLRDHQLENYPGNWLFGELGLPESWKVMESDYGDGFLVTDADEIITEIYTTKKMPNCSTSALQRLAHHDRHLLPGGVGLWPLAVGDPGGHGGGQLISGPVAGRQLRQLDMIGN